jgi:hypothetical protein
VAAPSLVEDLKGLASKLSGVKPGVKTTEFVVAAVFGLVNLLVSLGVIHTGIPARDKPEIEAAAAGAVALISVGYSIARGIAKHQPVDVLNALHLLTTDVWMGDPNADKTLKALLPSLAASAGVKQSGITKLESDIDNAASFIKTHGAALERLVRTGLPTPIVSPAPGVPLAPVITGDGTAEPSPGGMPIDPPGLLTTVASPQTVTASPAPTVTASL